MKKAIEPSTPSPETTNSDIQTAHSKFAGRFEEWTDDLPGVGIIGGVS